VIKDLCFKIQDDERRRQLQKESEKAIVNLKLNRTNKLSMSKHSGQKVIASKLGKLTEEDHFDPRKYRTGTTAKNIGSQEF
jgi:hypothetical protein